MTRVKWLAASVVMAAALGWGGAADAQSPEAAAARATFDARLKGKAVTLEQPLFTIALPSGSKGITVLSPDKGTYFRFVETSPKLVDISDSDATRLSDRIAAMKATTGGAKLLTYAAGSAMTIRGVQWGPRILIIELVDQFAGTGDAQPTTTVQVVWPQAFTATLTEGGEIEALIRKHLTVR